MINSFNILILFLVSTTILTNDLQIVIDSTSIESNNEFTRVEFSITGGTEPYRFTFTQIPTNWRQVSNGLFFPNSILSTNRKYPARLSVNDNAGNSFSGTLVIDIKDGEISVEQTVFSFDENFGDQFFNEEGFEGRPDMMKIQIFEDRPIEPVQNIEVRERTQSESEQMIVTTGSGLQKIVEALVPENESNIGEEVRSIRNMIMEKIEKRTIHSIEEIFSQLPDSSQLDQIILERDSFAISKTIQLVVRKESLSCQEKFFYIADFFGRIQSAIAMKQFTLEQLTIIIENARTQIERLNQQIQFLQTEIQEFRLEELQDALFEELRNLEEAYDIFNENYEKIEAERADQNRFNENKNRLQNEANDKNNEIEQKNEELTQTRAEINRLEAELEAARRKEVNLEEDILGLQSDVRAIVFQINIINRNLERIQFVIGTLTEKSEQLKNDYTIIETAIQKIREEMKNGRDREEEAFELITEYETQKAVEQSKISGRELRMLQSFISIINSTVPNIEEEVNKIYYNCFRAQDITSAIVDGKTTYQLSNNNFISYLQYTYQANPQIPSLTEEITLTPFYILDEKWSQAFGQPYEDVAVANSEEFSFSTDFNCLNPSTLENGNGEIVSIQKNVIKVKVENQEQQTILKLSPCSRIETTSELPAVEQQIYWKGNLNKDGQIEVYIATSV